MTTTLATAPFRIAPEALPGGVAPAERPQAARIHAIGIGDPAAPAAIAVLRQRRTSEMAVVISWHANGHGAALAEGVLAFAEAESIRLLRATPDQPEAIADLALADTGRGYAQRWIGPEIVSQHETGQYRQSTGFTCGPVSLCMAMAPEVSRSEEIAIWREATSIVSLTGPGGCDPYGLALSCAKRGFDVTVYFDATDAVLVDRASTEEKKGIIRFVQAEFREQAQASLPIIPTAITPEQLTEAVRTGAQVILLIDQCHTHDHHAPHWILIHAERDGLFLVNDPWSEPEDGEGIADIDCTPTTLENLMLMGAYGDPAYHGALILRRAG